MARPLNWWFTRTLLATTLACFLLIHGVLRPRMLPLLTQTLPPILQQSSPPRPPQPPLPTMAALSPQAFAPSTDQAFAGCASLRSSRLLVYATHSGFGNQELSLRRALLIAFILNRTLVLPPLLRQSELAFGPPEVRCRNASWRAYLQDHAETIYAAKLQQRARKAAASSSALSANGGYESLAAVYDLSTLTRLGVRTLDYSRLLPRRRLALGRAPLARLGCAKADKYTAAQLRQATRPLDSSPIVRLGSAYFLKAQLQGLRAADRCFDAVAAAVLALPMSRSIMRAADAAQKRLATPYASVHLRLADGGVATAAASTIPGPSTDDAAGIGSSAQRKLQADVHWLITRLSKRLPRAGNGVYVASNIDGGVRAPLLAPLCAAGNSGWNCSDLNTLGVRHLPVAIGVPRAEEVEEACRILVERRRQLLGDERRPARRAPRRDQPFSWVWAWAWAWVAAPSAASLRP